MLFSGLFAEVFDWAEVAYRQERMLSDAGRLQYHHHRLHRHRRIGVRPRGGRGAVRQVGPAAVVR